MKRYSYHRLNVTPDEFNKFLQIEESMTTDYNLDDVMNMSNASEQKLNKVDSSFQTQNEIQSNSESKHGVIELQGCNSACSLGSGS